MYPRDSAGNINPGYGAYPNAYNQIVENTPEAIDKLRSDSSRGANAILGMGNSVIAAGSYLGAKSFGADKATKFRWLLKITFLLKVGKYKDNKLH